MAGAERAGEGLPRAADLSDTDLRSRETASSETNCTRDSTPAKAKSESRVSAQARNSVSEMRFPVSRER